MITKTELYNLYVTKKMSSIQIANLKKIGRTTVLNYLTKFKIPKKHTGSQIKYNANHNCFDKWSSDMAYCLGFIAADGHVWEKRPYITIGIHKKDIKILKLIRDFLSPTSKVRISGSKCQICVYSQKIYNKLNKLGINYTKTFSLKLPKIPKKYLSHFIRGFFDGDGSIWKTKFKKGGKDYYYANIVSASPFILQDIYNFLQLGKISKIKNKYYEIKFCQSDCIKLANVIYKDANIKLERKYKKFLAIHQDYHFWSKTEDQVILDHIKERNTKQLIPLLPNRNHKTIQARKNYLRKKHNAPTKNCKN